MEDETKKSKEYEVQFSVKWINFTATVQATSKEEAIQIAVKEDAFTATVRGEEVFSLSDIFEYCGPAQVACEGEELL
jgi:hypothetical protein